MALRMELGIPPVYVLLRELTEEVRDLLLEPSSGQCETRPLFREPGLGGVREDVRISPKLCPQFLSMWGRGRKASPLPTTTRGSEIRSGTAHIATSLCAG